MPLAQYVDIPNGVRITKKFSTPKQIADVKYWIRAARKVIPEIPKNQDFIFIKEKICSPDTIYVIFELPNETPKHLVIDRNAHKGL